MYVHMCVNLNTLISILNNFTIIQQFKFKPLPFIAQSSNCSVNWTDCDVTSSGCDVSGCGFGYTRKTARSILHGFGEREMN